MTTGAAKSSVNGAALTEQLGTILPPGSVRYLALCVTGLVLFLCAGVLPARHQALQLKRTNENLQQQIERQDMMGPLYQQLHQAAAQKAPDQLKLKERTLEAKTDLLAIPATVQAWATNCPLSQVLVQPRIRPLHAENQVVCVDITLMGDWDGFRAFLTDLARRPDVERIEQIHVEQNNQGKQCKVMTYLRPQ